MTYSDQPAEGRKKLKRFVITILAIIGAIAILLIVLNPASASTATVLSSDSSEEEYRYLGHANDDDPFYSGSSAAKCTVKSPAADKLLSYLLSSKRDARFDAALKKMGPAVARALEAGVFGDASVVNITFRPMPGNYTGWGILYADADMPYEDVTASVAGWWDNGVLDLDRITSVKIAHKTTDTIAYIGDPQRDDSYWAADYTKDSRRYVSNANALRYYRCFGWEGPNAFVAWDIPRGLRANKAHDTKVLRQLEINARSWNLETH